MRKVILRQDSRDFHAHLHFGSISQFPDEKDFDVGLTNDIELSGEVDCTAESGADVCTDQTKVIYDHEDLWSLTPKTAQGATPQDSMGTIVKNGLKPLASGIRDTRWVSYFRADTGQMDFFDNTRSTMLLTNSSVTAATYWYASWGAGQPDDVMPLPVTPVGAHDYKICGWKKINGVDCFRIKAWLGYYRFMPREVYNVAMDAYGSGSYLPLTVEAKQKVQITLLQKILDALVNVLLRLKALLHAKT